MEIAARVINGGCQRRQLHRVKKEYTVLTVDLEYIRQTATLHKIIDSFDLAAGSSETKYYINGTFVWRYLMPVPEREFAVITGVIKKETIRHKQFTAGS